MSHSYKHTPICGFSKESEKQDKRFANRNLRREAKECVANALITDSLDDMVVPVIREVSCRWAFAKDGKQYLTNPEHIIKEMRK